MREGFKNKMPDLERVKDSLEKKLKKNTISTTSKNGLVTVIINGQQEITDLVIENRLIDQSKAGALKSSLVEALNEAIAASRDRMLQEAAKAINLFK